MPAEAGAKTPHDLHLSQGADDLVRRAAARGADLVELAGRPFQPGCRFAVLAVGSLTEGMGSAVSDLDLLVLHDRFEDWREPGAGLEVKRGAGVSLSWLVGGLDIDIEYYAWDRLRGLRSILVEAAGALRGGKVALPFLERSDERFLHRLRTGWVLRDEEMAQAWRHKLGADRLRALLALKNLIVCVETLEDAWAVVDQPTRQAGYTARNCVEYLMLAAAAAWGFTSPTRRFLFAYPVSRLSEAQQAQWRHGLDLLSAALPTDVAAQRAYVGQAHRFYRSLEALFAEDAELRPLVAHVNASLNLLLPQDG